MDLIITTESKLTELIENAVSKFSKTETPEVNKIPDNISGTKAVVSFLCENGYEVSKSLIDKQASRGLIPCRRFHNKRLLFSGKELLAWAESKCEPVGQNDAVLTLARSANSKLMRGGRK